MRCTPDSSAATSLSGWTEPSARVAVTTMISSTPSDGGGHRGVDHRGRQHGGSAGRVDAGAAQRRDDLSEAVLGEATRGVPLLDLVIAAHAAGGEGEGLDQLGRRVAERRVDLGPRHLDGFVARAVEALRVAGDRSNALAPHVLDDAGDRLGGFEVGAEGLADAVAHGLRQLWLTPRLASQHALARGLRTLNDAQRAPGHGRYSRTRSSERSRAWSRNSCTRASPT